MKATHLILLFALFFSACEHNKPASKKTDTLAIKPASASPAKVSETKISPIDTTHRLSGFRVAHLFSDSTQKDDFNITLFGEETLTGTVVFEIKNRSGKRLYREVFDAVDLLGDMEDVLNKQQKIDTINSRMAHFFDSENFTSPAIGKDDKIEESLYEPGAADIENWNEIKAAPTSVAFIFSYGYESTFGIAYSKKKQKAVLVFNSD